MIRSSVAQFLHSGFRNLNPYGFGFTTALFAILTFCHLSCSPSSPPEGILSKAEMAKAMTEFYLKESKITAMRISSDSALVLFKYYKQQYSQENNFSDSTLENSYQYYLSNPTELSEIYDRIIDSLALKEQRAGVLDKKTE